MTGTALVLSGPTAAGKSELAIAVAEAFDAVIVSADAMAVYRGMDVGTGKPSATERARAPHFGIDVREPTEPFTAADFVALADEVLASHPRVVIAGGTSLYLRSWVRGLVPVPPVDPGVRAEIEALPDPHRLLVEVDPDLAARLHPHDRVRAQRGLLVFRATGRRLSELQAEYERAPNRFEAPGLWIDRDDLDARIAERTKTMFEAGYVEEVRGLLSRGVPRDCKPMLSLGYRHVAAHVLDGVPLEEAARRTVRDTRRFARKQRTWRKQLPWPEVRDGHLAEVMRVAERVFR